MPWAAAVMHRTRPRREPHRRNSRRPAGRVLVRRLVVVTLLAWLSWSFARYARVRLSTPPAVRYDDARARLYRLRYPRRQGDVSAALSTAIAAIPREPVFDEPAPPGMRWDFGPYGPPRVVSVWYALDGDFKPAERPLLRVLIRYLGSPQLDAALRQVSTLADRPWRLRSLWPATAVRYGGVGRNSLRWAVTVFVARSRYLRAGRGDPLAAWHDLHAALRLLRRAPVRNMIDMLVVIGGEQVALRELRHWSLEAPIEPRLAGPMLEALGSLRPADALWTDACLGECLGEIAQLEAMYTDDGHGSGWRVFVRPDGKPANARPGTTRRSRLWNLLSCVYDDRATAIGRVRRFYHRAAALGNEPAGEALPALTELDRRNPFGPTLGPAYLDMHRSAPLTLLEQLYRNLLHRDASLRATQIMIALSAWRAEHGRWPASLAELVPRYLPSLPDDPYCGRAFGYRVGPDGSYVLYACGDDLEDDRGREATRQGPPPDPGGDLVFPQPRSGQMYEPKAVPIHSPRTSGVSPQ